MVLHIKIYWEVDRKMAHTQSAGLDRRWVSMQHTGKWISGGFIYQIYWEMNRWMVSTQSTGLDRRWVSIVHSGKWTGRWFLHKVQGWTGSGCLSNIARSDSVDGFYNKSMAVDRRWVSIKHSEE